jgi:hypothetical protein
VRARTASEAPAEAKARAVARPNTPRSTSYEDDAVSEG